LYTPMKEGSNPVNLGGRIVFLPWHPSEFAWMKGHTPQAWLNGRNNISTTAGHPLRLTKMHNVLFKTRWIYIDYSVRLAGCDPSFMRTPRDVRVETQSGLPGLRGSTPLSWASIGKWRPNPAFWEWRVPCTIDCVPSKIPAFPPC
jgi:hypothetical protein